MSKLARVRDWLVRHRPAGITHAQEIGTLVVLILFCLSAVFVAITPALSAAEIGLWETVGLVVAVALWLGAGATLWYTWRAVRRVRCAIREHRGATEADLMLVVNQFMETLYRFFSKTQLATAIALIYSTRYGGMLSVIQRHPLIWYLLILNAMVAMTILDVIQLLWKRRFLRP